MQRSDQSTQRDPGPGFTQRLLITLIWVYRYTFSYFLGGRCRFYPTCSEYGLGAIDAHGSWRGLILIARRIGRCHPWHGGGWDPVPPWSGSRPESSVK